MIADLFNKLAEPADVVDEEGELTVELVLPAAMVETVDGVVREALPDANFVLESALPSDNGEAYLFVTFVGLQPKGREATAFAFARELGALTSAREANPILEDSLFGASSIGNNQESALRICSTPASDANPKGWVHDVIDTHAAWTSTRGAGVTVAVIDTGYSDHDELAGVITGGSHLNLVEGGTDARDRFSESLLNPLQHPGHGTLVCSVIASRGTASTGGQTGGPGQVTGSAPDAKILPIRAIKSVINFKQKQLPPAIQFAVDEGADVIAMALGGPSRVATTEKALRNAVRAGIVVVCAAGNCWPKVVFPAAYATLGLCTAMAALQSDLRPWKKTGSGPEVTASAPGEDVWGASKRAESDPNDTIRPSQGTTLATSLTAGLAALWVAHHGGRAALKAKADDLGTTVQALFVSALTHGLKAPSVWNGSRKLGAGVVNARSLLDAPLSIGQEAIAFAGQPSPQVVSSGFILFGHLANHHPDAVGDLDLAFAPFASEALWLSQRSGARKRAISEGLELEIAGRDEPSPDLSKALTERPAMAVALGLGS
jgi:hypothetical protein